MGEISDIAVKWLDRKLPSAMEALGIRATAAVVQELDTPYPPASMPDSPPHKRTGNLQAGVTHTESNVGGDATTTIASKRAEGDERVPIFLEFGTSKMAARPYMQPVKNMASVMVPLSMRRSFDGSMTPHESTD